MSRIGRGVISPLGTSPWSTEAIASSSSASGLSPCVTPNKPTAKCYHFIEFFACNCGFPDDNPKISHVRGCEGLKDISKCRDLVLTVKQIYIDDLCVVCKSEAAMNEDGSEGGGALKNLIWNFKKRQGAHGEGPYKSMEMHHEDDSSVGSSHRKYSWSGLFSPCGPEESKQVGIKGLTAAIDDDYSFTWDSSHMHAPGTRFTFDDDAESWKDGCPLLSPPDDRDGIAEALKRAHERSIRDHAQDMAYNKHRGKDTVTTKNHGKESTTTKHHGKEPATTKYRGIEISTINHYGKEASTKHHGKETADEKAEKTAWNKSRDIWLSMPSVDNGTAIPESSSSVVSSVFGGFCKVLSPRYSLDDLSSEPGTVNVAEIEKWVRVSAIARGELNDSKEELNDDVDDLNSWEFV